MSNQYLLTYQHPKGFDTFAWFDSEHEMYEFIEENNLYVIGAYKIIEIEPLIGE